MCRQLRNWLKNNKLRLLTNAIANAGLRVRWNIWNLYIHLCWQTVEQQSIPALAIASAVMHKRRKDNDIAKWQWNWLLLNERKWICRHLSRPNVFKIFPTAHFFNTTFTCPHWHIVFCPTLEANPSAKAKEPILPTLRILLINFFLNFYNQIGLLSIFGF